ncbi:MAG: helix-hairpin-helix domain-containing protein [Bacteroidota bacterium]|nr:helix-hairpin-helix domain-containing protein [Bacteroidota bacterium]
MPGKHRTVSLLLMAWIPVIQHAQYPVLNSLDMEDLLYRNESAIIPETRFNADHESGITPINLNSASPEELEASELFSSYQIHNLLKYRDTFGPIYSIYELAALPGFHRSVILEIEPFVVINPVSIPERKFRGQHMVLINMERTFPLESEYRADPGLDGEARYAGQPLATCIRIRSRPWRRLTLACTYEKDAGELFLYQNRPQFLSANISYLGEGFIKQFVAGNFQLNQGVGLVNGSGFMHRAGNFRTTQQSLSRIRPYASKTESMFEQGVACKMGTKNFHLLMWTSFHRLSLSPSAFIENPEGDKWLDYQRTSGLYRTRGELEGRELAYRIHAGIQLLYRYKNLTLGVLNGSEWLGPTRKAMGQLKEDPEPFHSQKISLHGTYCRDRFRVSGEFSSDQFRSLAFLLGSFYHFNDFVQGGLLIHHYGADYHGSLPSSYASGSKLRNEQGLAFHLHLETGKFVTAKITSELFRYPGPRYLTNVPSEGYRLDLSLRNPGRHVIDWRIRWVFKSWQTTPADLTSGIRPLQDNRVNRLDGQLIYNHHDRFKWLSRLVIGYYSQKEEPVPAYAAVQQLTLGISTYLRASAQFVLFHVSDWENRIYLYEPGFYYSFNFPVYYGTGQKTTFLITLKPTSGISLSTKLSVRVNSGNKKWNAGLQLRLRF